MAEHGHLCLELAQAGQGRIEFAPAPAVPHEGSAEPVHIVEHRVAEEEDLGPLQNRADAPRRVAGGVDDAQAAKNGQDVSVLHRLVNRGVVEAGPLSLGPRPAASEGPAVPYRRRLPFVPLPKDRDAVRTRFYLRAVGYDSRTGQVAELRGAA